LVKEIIGKMEENKKEKFSYSKLDTYNSCGWKYKLKYIDKNFVDSDLIAADFGTLVHYIEETIANDIIANNHEPHFMLDDQKYIDLFINVDIANEKETILGIKKIKEKYPKDFYVEDKSGMDYAEKANHYLNFGIYRLRDYLAENRHMQIIAIEQPFEIEYNGFLFHGFIDRVFRNTLTGEIIVEDIKTWWTIDKHELTTPLQFVLYTKAAQEIYKTENIRCFYDLPLAKNRYQAGTKGFIKRGFKKIDALLESIGADIFIPKPSPLCAWCPYSPTNPNHIEKEEALCPYHSNYTKKRRDFSVNYIWADIENHAVIQEDFLNKRRAILQPIMVENTNLRDENSSRRIFLGRRE